MYNDNCIWIRDTGLLKKTEGESENPIEQLIIITIGSESLVLIKRETVVFHYIFSDYNYCSPLGLY